MCTPAKVAVDGGGVCAELVVDDFDGDVGRFSADAHENQMGEVLDDLVDSGHVWGLGGRGGLRGVAVVVGGFVM